MFEKPKANWVKEFNFAEQSLRMKVSDKGAVQILTILPSGQERHLFCIPHAVLTAFVNVSGDIGNVLSSPEFQAIIDNSAVVKEQAKVERQKVATANKLIQKIEGAKARAKLEEQAALRELESMGYTLTKKQA